MCDQRLKVYEASSALERTEGRDVAAGRPAPRLPEVSLGEPIYRTLWCRVTSGAPGSPPDERYYADEVRPSGIGPGGELEWELVPGGLRQVVVHNVAEAALGTHLVAEDTVVRVSTCLDRSTPPQIVYFAHVPVATQRLARIVSYDAGSYTVQPVRREAGGFVDEGAPISGVPNLGELWSDEAGYLSGPSAFDRYVRIFHTPAGWTLVLHPPRMV